MQTAFRLALWLLARSVLPLRYRVRFHGWEEARGLKGPVLILPNHPGYIDPMVVLTYFYRAFRPRPVLYEGNFQHPALRPMVALLRAIPIPDLEQPSHEALGRAEQAVNEVIGSLRHGENVVLWPAGHLQHDGVERLGAARALADILRAVPEADVLLVRTRGVWGSMFSYAQTGRLPDLGRCFLNGFLLFLANLLFFAPRRRLDITLEPLDRSKLPELERDPVNRWFEAWYNIGAPERPTYVPYHFLFGPRTYDFPAAPTDFDGSPGLDQVRADTRTAVTEIVADKLGRALTPNEQRADTRLDELGLDSLQRMELGLAIEQRFGFSSEAAPATLGQLMAVAQGLVEKASSRPAPPEWFRAAAQTKPLEILGETIHGAFVARALADGRAVAAADDQTGVVTYERLLAGALLMSRRFARLPAANFGLMLPASVACDMMLLALLLADKLPVLLNWTTGPANLRHAARLTSLTHVITSWRLRDRLGIAIEGVEFIDVEDLGGQVRWLERIGALLAVRLLPNRIRARVPQTDPNAPAVILFTSGSEKAPKAVPLTHRNVLANHRGALAAFSATTRDSILGFLPMFHSFGFTITGTLPLLAGVRVVHHPDPTDAAALARKVGAYRPTIVFGTPAFIEHLFDRARAGELDSFRLVLVGAEKCPDSLFEKARRVVPGAHLLEGYGVTECSPVIAVNRPEANRPGSVGKPLPGVLVCVTDLESGAVLPPGRMGMLQVSGPTVFPGYLGEEIVPFVEHEKRRWYITGDLVEIDSDGFIHFRGRLKRFLKAGGEMISLPALEEPFAVSYPPNDNGPRVAVEGVEAEGGRRIVLFTTEPITLKEANGKLNEQGFRGVMRLDEVRRLESIPVLGTGKVDYRGLRRMIGTEQQAVG